MLHILKVVLFFQYQDIIVLKKDADRCKEELKIQETKANVAAQRLKTETDTHRETRWGLKFCIYNLFLILLSWNKMNFKLLWDQACFK